MEETKVNLNTVFLKAFNELKQTCEETQRKFTSEELQENEDYKLLLQATTQMQLIVRQEVLEENFRSVENQIVALRAEMAKYLSDATDKFEVLAAQVDAYYKECSSIKKRIRRLHVK